MQLQQEILQILKGAIEDAMEESDIHIDYADELGGLICVQHSVSWSIFMTIAFSFTGENVHFEVKTARRGEDDLPVENLVVNTTVNTGPELATFLKAVGDELRNSELYAMANPYA